MRILQNFQRGRADANIILMAIVDGQYYSESRLGDLRLNTRDHPPRSFALPIQEVPAVLNKLTQNANFNK